MNTAWLAARVSSLGWRFLDWARAIRTLADCRCGHDREDGRHLPASECMAISCPNPADHHTFRRRHWWAR